MRPELADHVQPQGLHNVELVGRRGHFRTGILRQQQRRPEQRKFQFRHVRGKHRLNLEEEYNPGEKNNFYYIFFLYD